MPAGKTLVNLFRSKHTFIYYSAQLLKEQLRKEKANLESIRIDWTLQQTQTRTFPVTPNGGPYKNQFSSRKKKIIYYHKKTNHAHTCAQEKRHSFFKRPAQPELGNPENHPVPSDISKAKGVLQFCLEIELVCAPGKGSKPREVPMGTKKKAAIWLDGKEHLPLSQTDVPTELCDTHSKKRSRGWRPGPGSPPPPSEGQKLSVYTAACSNLPLIDPTNNPKLLRHKIHSKDTVLQ